MRLERLRLQAFRNYGAVDLSWGPAFNVLLGPNGAGKTNLLEGIALLATGRSPRAVRDPELVQWGESGYLVWGRVARRAGPTVLELRYRLAPAEKRLRVDGAEVASTVAGGGLQAVFFSPEDLGLVRGAPVQRRRFADGLLAQLSATYRHLLLAFGRALAQRNQVLRELAGRRLDAELVEVLTAWDASLADAAAGIIRRRAALTATLEARAAGHYAGLAGGGERLGLSYCPAGLWGSGAMQQARAAPTRAALAELAAGAGPDAAAEPPVLRERLLSVLEVARRDDIKQGATAAGPHRDEWRVWLDGSDIRSFGSRGQQRCAALALRLAERELLAEASGEAPLLLLDDVLSELDEERRRRLLSLAGRDSQVFLAATALHGQALPPGSTVFAVEQGRVRPAGTEVR